MPITSLLRWWSSRKKSSATPEARLRSLREMLWDPSARFSIRGTFDELDTIETELRSQGAVPVELRGELAYCRAYLAHRRGDHQECIAWYGEAIAADDEHSFLPERLRISARLGIAQNYEASAGWDEAVAAYRDVLPEIEESSSFTEDALGGAMEKLAFCLHETGDYGAALELNRRVLALGEKVHGSAAFELRTCLVNMAQNHHALGDPTAAKPLLVRVLSLGEAFDDDDLIVEMRFQLGVLAFEASDINEAKKQMDAAKARAEESGDSFLVELCEKRREELAKRSIPKTEPK